MPLLHLLPNPPSCFPQNVHDITGEIVQTHQYKTCHDGLISRSWWIVFANILPGIPTKQNINETASKQNIWGLFCIPKVEDSGGRQ